MKNLFVLWFVLCLSSGAVTHAAEESWSTVSGPAGIEANVPFEIKITTKGAPAGGKIGVDLHYSKKDGKFGGFLVAGQRLEFTGDGSYIFKFKTGLKPDTGVILPIVFLSPDGSFGKNTKLDRSAKLAIAGTDLPKTAPAPGPKPGPKPGPAPAPAAGDKPAGITFKKSWIHIRPPSGQADPDGNFTVMVDYYLDPSENWGTGTKLKMIPLGPWIDNPDGKYSTKRMHVGYPGLNMKMIDAAAGKHEAGYSFKLGKTFRYNELLLHAVFVMPDGKEWPWRTMEGGPEIVRTSEFYDIVINKPGGLFTYDEPVKFSVRFNAGAVAGEKKKLTYQTVDASGAETSGNFDINVGKPGTSQEFTLKLDRKGTFLLETNVDGWGARDHFFARVPDLMKLTGGAPTSFGATNIRTDSDAKTARMLGLTYNRLFTSWAKLQPAPDVWQLEDLDATLEVSAKNGLKPWLSIQAPPAYVMPDGVFGGGFQPFPFEDAQWRNTVSKLSARYKDKIIGWEWLNEIVPGTQTKTPVEDYLKFCRIGAEEARKVNPKFELQLAGGLWPVNFRNDLLKAGVGKYVDILPVHYSNYAGVSEARENLDATGLKSTRVWDNETASGISTWDMPAREMLKITRQSQWVLDRWPDELIAGAERIIYFGGDAQAAGNWTYLQDETTPRPLAATLAVLTSKLEGAKPLGKFFLPGQGVFHLFEKNGKAILVASTNNEAGEKIDLDLHADRVTVTDYQGNETSVPGRGSFALTPMRIFIEGGDLKTLKRYIMLNVGSNLEPIALPQTVLSKGPNAKITFNLYNPYEVEFPVRPSVGGLEGWEAQPEAEIKLAPGERRSIEVPVKIPASAASGTFQLKASLGGEISWPFSLTLISPEMVGNLLKNGDFEDASSKAWAVKAPAEIVPSAGDLGVGAKSIKFTGTGWSQAIQSLKTPPGQDLLYTAWIWSQGMKQAGSNISLKLDDGKKKDYNIPQTFDAGPQTPFWRLVSKRVPVPANVTEATFIPLASGTGFALFDNLRVTLYDGTNFAAEAPKLSKPITIDGKLDEWKKSCPIPLLGDNQLAKHDPNYQWTPQNLAGVVYLAWDEKALYLAAEVNDDVQSAPATGEETSSGDSLTLAIHPANRAPGKDEKAFEYLISAASPGGGSGKNTLYRPPSKAGGLSSGQLAKDSSNYDLAIVRSGNKTTYELKLPWLELGGIQPAFGSKFGLSLELNDNDGKGRAATMSWGDGLSPAWNPRGFGVGTLTGE